MTPREKAKELIKKISRYTPNYGGLFVDAKACAVILCDEVICSFKNFGLTENDTEIEFWEQVKEEIKAN